MKKKRIPKSLKKHIRQEKARLRREILNVKKREESINGLYKKFLKDRIKPEVKK
jgi:hypothetical protein